MNISGTDYGCNRYNTALNNYSKAQNDYTQAKGADNASENTSVGNKQSARRTKDEFTYSTSAVGNYSAYGTGGSANITVDPEFLAEAENDPELKAKLLSDIDDIRRADMMFSKQQSANGIKIVSQGWYIDKNGDIGSWVITKTERGNEKSLMQRMNENLDKIRTKKAKKKIEEEKRKIAIQKRKIENEKRLLALKKKKKAVRTGRILNNYA